MGSQRSGSGRKQSDQANAEKEQQGQTSEARSDEQSNQQADRQSFDSSRTAEEGMVKYVSNIDGDVVLYDESGNQFAFTRDEGTPLNDAEADQLTKQKAGQRQYIKKQ